MPIEITHKADRFHYEISNIDKVLDQLKKFPDSLNTGASSKIENGIFYKED